MWWPQIQIKLFGCQFAQYIKKLSKNRIINTILKSALSLGLKNSHFNVRALRHFYAVKLISCSTFCGTILVFIKCRLFFVKKEKKIWKPVIQALYNHIVYSRLDSTCILASDCILLLFKMLLFQHHSSCQIISLIIPTTILIYGFKILLLGSEM
jgi:hypothetical protein